MEDDGRVIVELLEELTDITLMLFVLLCLLPLEDRIVPLGLSTSGIGEVSAQKLIFSKFECFEKKFLSNNSKNEIVRKSS